MGATRQLKFRLAQLRKLEQALEVKGTARHPTAVTLGLAGECPCIVCADAPLDVTARRIARGKFVNAGQTCVAPDVVLVDRRVRETLLEALKRAVRGFYGDDPRRSPDCARSSRFLPGG